MTWKDCNRTNHNYVSTYVKGTNRNNNINQYFRRFAPLVACPSLDSAHLNVSCPDFTSNGASLH